ncbi:MAG: patatin-like phospholipase family protein [Granulosicoccaceae bacterium]
MTQAVNLGLQGGGAHGAFSWGVLDKLLEDGRLHFDGVCACSAGSMNAVALAHGFCQGGNDGARESLEHFWHQIHQAGRLFGSVKRPPWSWWGRGTAHSVSYFMLDNLTRFMSPYQFNPLDINPLRDVLENNIDFERLRQSNQMQLFISTTHVRTGRVKVFQNAELTSSVVLASACLPRLFKAVEIDGEDYWDGGYMGNPSLFPLFYNTDTSDILLIYVNPVEREGTPSTPAEIETRLNEITFNSSLIKDIRAIAFVKKLLQHDMLNESYRDRYKNILLHAIEADALLPLSSKSKSNTEWKFLTDLRDKGRDAADAWLEAHFDKLGKRDSVDLEEAFLGSVGEMFKP